MDKKVNTNQAITLFEQFESVQNLEQLDLDTLSRKELCDLIKELGRRKAELVRQSQAEQETHFLLTFIDTISQAVDFNSALYVTLKLVCEQTGWVLGEVWLPTVNKTALELSPVYYIREPGNNHLIRFRTESEGSVFPLYLHVGLPGRIWALREPIWFRDVSSLAEETFLRVEYAQAAGLGAALGVPIISNDDVLAILIFYATEIRPKDKRLVALISAAATQLGTVLQGKQTKTALQESQAFSQSIYAGTGAAIYVLDVDRNGDFYFADVNPTVTRLIGWTREMVRGKRLHELPPSKAAAINTMRALYQQCVETGNAIEQEIIAPLEGEEFRWLTRLEPLQDAEGRVYRIINTSIPITRQKQVESGLEDHRQHAEDIGEGRTAELETLNKQFQQEIKARKRLEEALQQSNIFKQVVLDSLPAHIAVLDREGNIIAVNRAWFQFTRENKNAILIQAGVGDNYLEVCRRGVEAGDRSARKALAIISTVLASQQTHLSMEYPCHSAQEKRWFLMHVTPLTGGDGGAVIVHENISVRKRAEEAVRESRERYRAIFTQAAVGIAIISTEGRWLQVNQKLCEIMGYTSKELRGLTLQAITHPDDLDADFEDIQRILAGEIETSIMEKRYIRKDGSIAWVNLTISLVQEPNGDPKYFIAVIEDITRRKQVEASLLWRNRELALLSQSTQAFNASLDQEETLTTILEAIRYLLEITVCRVWLVDKETGELVCQQVNEQGSKLILDQRLTPGKGLAGWVAQHNQSVIVPDIRLDERPFQEIDPQTDKDIRSALSIPLRVKQKVIGVLQALDTTPDRFTLADLELLEPLALTAAMAIENARLYEQAQQDAHTKATLLKEVNHRVKNNLAAIVGLLYTKRRRFGLSKDSTIYQAITEDIIGQVQGLATVHSLLSASEWTPLHLSELTSQIVRSSLRILPHTKRISVDIPHSPVQVTPEQANNLALIINELTTNTIKYASPKSPTPLKITVYISLDEDQIQFEFRDNGLGYPKAILQLDPDAYSVGFEVIQNIVRKNLRGKLSLYNDQGAVTVIEFEAMV